MKKFDDLIEENEKQLDEIAISAGIATGLLVGTIAKNLLKVRTQSKGQSNKAEKELSAYWDEQKKKSETIWNEKIKNAKDEKTKAKYKQKLSKILKRYESMKKLQKAGRDLIRTGKK